MHDIKPIKKNPFAEKYRKTLQHRDMDRQAKAMGGEVPKEMRRDNKRSKAMSRAKMSTFPKDLPNKETHEKSKKWRNAFTEAVGIHNKAHPE